METAFNDAKLFGVHECLEGERSGEEHGDNACDQRTADGNEDHELIARLEVGVAHVAADLADAKCCEEHGNDNAREFEPGHPVIVLVVHGTFLRLWIPNEIARCPKERWNEGLIPFFLMCAV